MSNLVETTAQTLWTTYSSRNPSWGGDDSWEQQPEYRRDDFRAMAWAALQQLGLINSLPSPAA